MAAKGAQAVIRRVLRRDGRFFVLVSVADQVLAIVHLGKIAKKYLVSTARAGVGARKNSGKTPPGLHRIKEKIGARAFPGAVFKDRINTGEVWDGSSQFGDLILSRIIRLEGMEKGVNKGGTVDTFSRYIYIHGTNHESTIGKPTSQGCITMRNKDIMDLFKRVKKGDLVAIT